MASTSSVLIAKWVSCGAMSIIVTDTVATRRATFRQTVSESRHHPSLVRSHSISRTPPGRVDFPTESGWDQLAFARARQFTANTDARAWTIPTRRALCVPDGSRLRIETTRRAAVRCLYTRTELGLLDNRVRAFWSSFKQRPRRGSAL